MMDIPISYVSLASNDHEERNGIDTPHVWIDDEIFRDYMDGGQARHRRNRLQYRFDYAVMCLAGPVVEATGRGLPLSEVIIGSGSFDAEQACMIAENIGGAGNKDRVLSAALKHVRRLVLDGDGLPCVLRVSSALATRGRLEVEEVQELMEYEPEDDDGVLNAFNQEMDDGVVVVLEDPAVTMIREQLRQVLAGPRHRGGGAGAIARGPIEARQRKPLEWYRRPHPCP